MIGDLNLNKEMILIIVMIKVNGSMLKFKEQGKMRKMKKIPINFMKFWWNKMNGCR